MSWKALVSGKSIKSLFGGLQIIPGRGLPAFYSPAHQIRYLFQSPMSYDSLAKRNTRSDLMCSQFRLTVILPSDIDTITCWLCSWGVNLTHEESISLWAWKKHSPAPNHAAAFYGLCLAWAEGPHLQRSHTTQTPMPESLLSCVPPCCPPWALHILKKGNSVQVSSLFQGIVQ